MKERILEELHKIEQTHDVKIIMAIESGSRAWGFASPDSDYDVRFIYVRNKEDYLKLEGIRDVIEWKLDEVLDINGWDIRKALQLLHKSNPTIFEWCASPIVYLETPEFAVLKSALPNYFSEKKALYYYWHMAQTNYREYLKGEEVRIKKYFYVLRPLIAAQWILERNVVPPMLFDELVAAELDKEFLPELECLLEMKKTLPEIGMAPKVQGFNDYIEKIMPEIKEAVGRMEETETDWAFLNEVFLQFVDK